MKREKGISQVSIRSEPLFMRMSQLSADTGLTKTSIVEHALTAWLDAYEEKIRNAFSKEPKR